MNVSFNWQMIVFFSSLLLGWTGFLLGAIKWLLTRQIASIEERLQGAETKASEAINGTAALKSSMQDSLQNSMKGFNTDLLTRCVGHTGRLSEAELKIERIGAEIRNLPQHRHMQDLSNRIEQVHSGVEKVVGRLEGVGRAVDLINQFLIEQGGKK